MVSEPLFKAYPNDICVC